MSRFSSYNEELGINTVEDTGVYATGDSLKKYVPSMEDRDLEKFIIIKSKLLYVGTDEKEAEIANRLGIGGGEATSDAGATVQEVQAIVDGVVEVSDENKSKIPEDDEDKVGEPEYKDDKNGLIGTRLFDRNSSNIASGTWNILIEYNNQNKEMARYGSGYYWLKKGEKYVIKGKEIEFKNDYVINYKNEEFTVLSGRAVNWNVKATLGVSENEKGENIIALNLDPMSLTNGEWKDSGEVTDVTNIPYYSFFVKSSSESEIDTGIQRTGDVEYDKDSKALKFNENEDVNPNGEGGLIRLKRNDLNFEQGLTFEIYTKLHRLKCNKNGYDGLGLFCKGERLLDVGGFMRFGFFSDYGRDIFCKLYHDEGATYEGTNGFFYYSGGVGVQNFDLELDQDFYLSIVYDVKKNGKMDELRVYYDGEFLGACDYRKSTYAQGQLFWGDSNAPFYVGYSPFGRSGKESGEYCANGNEFFLKGLVYSIRLYTAPLTQEQVKLNYEKTVKYRDSFKND